MFGLDGCSPSSRTTSRTCSTACAWAAPRSTRSRLALLDECGRARRRPRSRSSAAARAPRRVDESIAELIGAHRRVGAAPPAAAGAALDARRAGPALLRALTEYEEHRLRESLGAAAASTSSRRPSSILPSRRGWPSSRARSARSARCSRRCRRRAARSESQIRFSAAGGQRARRARSWPRASSSRRAAVRAARAPTALPRRAEGARPPRATPSAGGASRRGEPTRADPRRCGRGHAEVALRDRARRHPQARRADEPGRRAGDRERAALARARDAPRAETAPPRASAPSSTRSSEASSASSQELQAGVLEVRMVPLRQVFEKLSRVVTRACGAT